MRRDLCNTCGSPSIEDGSRDCPPLPHEETYGGLKEQLDKALTALESIMLAANIHNACNEPCDVVDGPCACGAWHNLRGLAQPAGHGG
jgi:hypothetical protein